MATAKDCHVLTSYYVTLWKARYGKQPVVNRNKSRWGFDAMLYDMSVADVKELLDFYVKETSSSNMHSLHWFHNNYELVQTNMQNLKDDRALIVRLMEESRKRAEEN